MDASPEITLLILAWPIVVAVVILRLLRKPTGSVGIVTVYLITFTVTYWFAPVLQLVPGYMPLQDPNYTRLGFVVSAIGLSAFLCGTLLAQYKGWLLSSHSNNATAETHTL